METTEDRDLRTVVLAAAAWVGTLLGSALEGPSAAVAVGALLAGAAAAVRRPSRRMLAACLLVAAVLAGSAAVRETAVSTSAVAAWAAERPVAVVEVVVGSDPVVRWGRFGDYAVVRATTRSVQVRGHTHRTVVPLLLVGAEEAWTRVPFGATVRAVGRLAPSDGGDVAAVLTGARPEVLAPPSRWLGGAESVRASVRRAAAGGPGESDALVPALVTGDDQRLPGEVVADFQTAGLTHLTAVSGTNLTLVLGFLLLIARWCAVRGRGLLVVGLLGVVGFVLMARPEPSVLRAAAMGTVALVGLGSGGRAAGTRALGAAAFGLLVVVPQLARSPGFALSVLATAGILLIAPRLRDALAGWLPAPVAEALAVPLAAQVACTPLMALALLTVLSGAALLWADHLLARRRLALVGAALLVLALLQPLRLPPGWLPEALGGWPPRGWVMVACDVGQGDALVLATGPGEAVVVDAGPDPGLVDACLRRLRVRRVPAVVLTHFHADHVDGLSGVLHGRVVGEVEVSPLESPAPGAAEVGRAAEAARVPVRVPVTGEVRSAGSGEDLVTWQVVGPRRVLSENPNDGSLVLLVDTHGLRLLLTGDVEPASQQPLLHERLGPVDVLKVPHHGSRYQDPSLLTGLGARLAIVSVGADNDYGHPDPGTLGLLEDAGMTVRRTDLDGDVAVLVRDGRLAVAGRDA